MKDHFCEVLDKLKDGMKITFTPQNVADGDHFLIFGSWRPQQTVTFRNYELWYVLFEGDHPMLLENCPDSFYESILKNIHLAQY